MSTVQLRDYQDAARQQIYMAFGQGHKRVICKMPTGAGKTALAGSIISMEQKIGNRVAFVVPFLSLIDQTVDRFREYGLTDLGVIQGDHPLRNPNASIQICSAQTLIRRSFPDVNTVVVDEAHKQFIDLNEWIGRCDRVLGLTATPWAKGMAATWDQLVCPVTIDELTELGYLCPVKVLVPAARPNLKGVKSKRYDWGKDYDQKALSERMRDEQLVGDIVSTWKANSDCSKTLIFAVDREHARSLQKEIQQNELECGYVDAFTPREERAKLAEMLMDGRLNAIVNIATMTTGVDFDVRTIILARPTRSRMLYQQVVGRGLRPADGKDHLLLLDHSPTTQNLGLVNEIDAEGLHLDEGELESKRVSRDEPPRRECAECHAVQPKGAQECPFCGHVPEKRIKATVRSNAAGTLEEYKVADELDPELQLVYTELRSYGFNREYKPGWAWHKFKEKTGLNPPRAWSGDYVRLFDMQIRPETLSWIKSSQIRWAKRRVA